MADDAAGTGVHPGDRTGHPLEGRKILVVGATGFLGRALVQRLAGYKAQVVAMSRHGTVQQRSDFVEDLQADASVSLAVEHTFRTFRPDMVFQLTTDGHGGPDLDFVMSSLRNDVMATVNTLYHAAAASHKVERFVMTASLEEPQSGPGMTPARPSEPTPASPYAAAKWATGAYGRMFRHLYGLDVRIVRPMMAYGPGQKTYKVIPNTILSLLRGEAAKLDSGSRLIDWVYVDDVVCGLVDAALAPALDETVDLGSGALVSIADCAQEIARQIGRPDLLEISDGVRGPEIERVADVAAARRLIGFGARVPLQAGLAQTIAWYRNLLQLGAP
jgi:nucleoside-diphosphate-sugar epimerase